MSNQLLIARPYAKAVFEIALQNEQLASWSDALRILAAVILQSEVVQFLTSPQVTTEMACDLIDEVFRGLQKKQRANDSTIDDKKVKALIHILAFNKRLLLLPVILTQYESLRAEQEKTMVAHVVTYLPLTQDQEQRLINALQTRYHRTVTLDITQNKTLLGGAVIYMGDQVIDGSIRGQLNQLYTALGV